MDMDQRGDFFAQTGGFQQPSRHEEDTEVKTSSSDGIQGKRLEHSLLTPTQSKQTTRQTTLHAQFNTEQTAETNDIFSPETVLHSDSRRRIRERKKKQTQRASYSPGRKKL